MVWGATGQLLVINEFADSVGLKIACVVDENKRIESPLLGTPIVHSKAELADWLTLQDQSIKFSTVVAIGGSRGRERATIAAELQSMGLAAQNVIHPYAHIAEDATYDDGLQLMMGAVVATRCHLGSYCIVNTNASIDHECNLSSGVHVGPGACLAGCVYLGKNSFIGAGATVLPKIKIGDNVIVGAGSVVTKNLPNDCTAYGNPARIITQPNR